MTTSIVTTSYVNETRWQSFVRQLTSPWYKQISVEPTMFLYMFAFMITSVVEQDFFEQKACRVNNNFSDVICSNINAEENKSYKRQVQVTTTEFLQWQRISAHLFPIVLALFLGSFSDRRGRKLPLLFGLFGRLIYSLMIVVNAKMKTWPLDMIIYTATLPSALTGLDMAIFSSCYAYISDISTLRNRTLRITILMITFLSAKPTGVILGSYLFYNKLQESYDNIFLISATLVTLSIIYSLLVLKWQTTDKQHSLRKLGCCGVFRDFFDLHHVKATFSVLTKKRPGQRRIFLIFLLVAMALYTFQRDESLYLYMYTKLKFYLNLPYFGTFWTFEYLVYIIVMVLAIPLMNKYLKWRDTTIIFIGVCAHIIGRLFYYFATSGQLFFAGAVVCSLGPIVEPMIRAMISKIVSQSESGKVFALLSVCDNVVPFVSGICYSQVYSATVDANGGSGEGVFLLTIVTQTGVFVLILLIHFVLGEHSLAVPELKENEMHQVCTNVVES